MRCAVLQPTICTRVKLTDAWRMSVTCQVLVTLSLVQAFWPTQLRCDEVVFADDLDPGLSSEWNIASIPIEDYRLRDGALELRVQPGMLSDKTPMVSITFPHKATDVLIAPVDIAPLDPFSEQSESAGFCLASDRKTETGTRKQFIDGQLVLSPPQPEFIGQPGEEGDPEKYALRFWPATKESGPLRVIVRDDVAYAQTGPSGEGNDVNLYHAALVKNPKQRGFALLATGGPVSKAHWVRFDNVRVVRSR